MATTLKLIKVQKNGYIRYSLDTVRGSVFVTSNMFEGEPPAELCIDATFAAPKASKTVDPAKVAERAAKATERLTKAEEKAVKAAERAQKAIDRAQKIKDKLAGIKPAAPAEAPAEPVSA